MQDARYEVNYVRVLRREEWEKILRNESLWLGGFARWENGLNIVHRESWFVDHGFCILCNWYFTTFRCTVILDQLSCFAALLLFQSVVTSAFNN